MRKCELSACFSKKDRAMRIFPSTVKGDLATSHLLADAFVTTCGYSSNSSNFISGNASVRYRILI